MPRSSLWRQFADEQKVRGGEDVSSAESDPGHHLMRAARRSPRAWLRKAAACWGAIASRRGAGDAVRERRRAPADVDAHVLYALRRRYRFSQPRQSGLCGSIIACTRGESPRWYSAHEERWNSKRAPLCAMRHRERRSIGVGRVSAVKWHFRGFGRVSLQTGVHACSGRAKLSCNRIASLVGPRLAMMGMAAGTSSAESGSRPEPHPDRATARTLQFV